MRFSELCRITGGIGIICFLTLILYLVGSYPGHIYNEEIKAIQSLKAVFSGDVAAGSVPMGIAVDAATAAARSNPGSATDLDGAAVPVVIAGIEIGIPPVVWLVACIIASIFLVQFVVTMWNMVVNTWRLLQRCTPSSGFWAFLGCIFSWVWAIVQTVIAVLISVLMLVVVLINVAALVAAF